MIYNDKDTIYIICGGLNECPDIVNIIDRGYGIVNIYDDKYIIKLLKQKNMFIGGKWVKINNNICITGIDAANPVQQLNKIVSTVPVDCSLYIIVSPYSLAESKCSKVYLDIKNISLGLPPDLSNYIMSLANLGIVLFMVCPNQAGEVCLDNLGNRIKLISIPINKYIIKLKIKLINDEPIIEHNDYTTLCEL